MPNFLINVTTKGAGKATSGMKKLSSSLGTLAKVGMAGAAAGAVGLGVAMKKASSLAAEQEKQEKMLTAALGKNADALIKQAGALQQNSIFGDEEIIKQQAYLASIGMTEQQIKDMLPVTMDLAAATGMSLESAVKNTAKTLSGMTGELGESVGALKDLSAEELKAGKGIEVMREMFKGMAEAETQTLQGALQQAKNAVGDLGESFGSLVTPLANAGAAFAKDFAEKATKAMDFIKRIDFKATANNFLQNLGSFGNAIIKQLTLAFSFLPTAFKTAIGKIWPILKTIVKRMMDIFKRLGKLVWDPLVISAKIAWAKISQSVQLLGANIKNFFTGAINIIKDQLNSLMGLTEMLGFEFDPFEAGDIIDIQSMKDGFKEVNDSMKDQLFDTELMKMFTDQNEKDLRDFTEESKQIWKEYLDSVIVLKDTASQKDADLISEELMLIRENAKKKEDERKAEKKAAEDAQKAAEDAIEKRKEEIEGLRIGKEIRREIRRIEFDSAQEFLQNIEKKEEVQVKEIEGWELLTSVVGQHEEALISQGQMAIQNLANTARAFPVYTKVAKAAAISETLINTYKSATSSYAALAPIMFVGPALGAAAAATAIASGMSNVQQIRAAATGMDEVVSSPTMILAGEQGAEQVSITPLEGPNIDGPQGAGIVVNVTGNVMSQDYVEGELAEQIKIAIQRGSDFGTN